MYITLKGTDPDGWDHTAVICEDGSVDITSVGDSPQGRCGGTARVSKGIFNKNYRDVTWHSVVIS